MNHKILVIVNTNSQFTDLVRMSKETGIDTTRLKRVMRYEDVLGYMKPTTYILMGTPGGDYHKIFNYMQQHEIVAELK